MKNDRDMEKMVSRMDLRHGSRQAVAQYGRGMVEGMRLAYVSVARKMFSQGRTEREVRSLLGGLVNASQLREILAEAAGEE